LLGDIKLWCSGSNHVTRRSPTSLATAQRRGHGLSAEKGRFPVAERAKQSCQARKKKRLSSWAPERSPIPALEWNRSNVGPGSPGKVSRMVQGIFKKSLEQGPRMTGRLIVIGRVGVAIIAGRGKVRKWENSRGYSNVSSNGLVAGLCPGGADFRVFSSGPAARRRGPLAGRRNASDTGEALYDPLQLAMLFYILIAIALPLRQCPT